MVSDSWETAQNLRDSVICQGHQENIMDGQYILSFRHDFPNGLDQEATWQRNLHWKPLKCGLTFSMN